MTAGELCLSAHTASHLPQPPHQSHPLHPISFSDVVVVGASQAPALPVRVALPFGLTLAPAAAPLDPSTTTPFSPAQVVTLHLRTSLRVNPAAIRDAVQTLASAAAVTVDGAPLYDPHTLGDVVSVRGPRRTCAATLFRAPPHRGAAKPAGLLLGAPCVAPRAEAVVDVDAVAYCSPTATRADVIAAFAAAADRLLSCALEVSAGLAVRFAHYAVLGGGFAISVVSPVARGEGEEDETSEAQVEWRRSVHEALSLPLNRPLLRSSMRVYCGDAGGLGDGGYPGRLGDVHVGVKGHGMGEGGVTEHLVQGRYLYCHYLQDGLNDSGWGCAYRSLQTIMSWCAMEGYATFEGGILPTHRAIQKALVEVGDKGGRFVGSKEWIGANEVCYALEKLTGVQSKILHVSRGGEMEGKGRELAQHFDEQGSPVMVGGGVLAWTILGVSRNSRTGRTRFLILDPHYEGRDDISVIQGKGWVGWKPADIFKTDSFYNLCMPMRPTGV